MKIIIEYDPIEKTLHIVENDFSTFEAFGILEAAKCMVNENWHDRLEGEDDE